MDAWEDRYSSVVLAYLVLLNAFPLLSELDGWPQTRAEATNYQETSSYGDVVQFLRGLQRNGAPITIEAIGKSPKGFDLLLVVASTSGSTPASARRSGKPIIYIQANIHGGEVEGKEAALMMLRDIAQQHVASNSSLLDKVVLLVVPVYNIDGNERLGPGQRNRPNQDGPATVGERANGQGLDLNRDATKAEAPETRAVLENVYATWDPDVMMDLHTTNGTRHGYQLTYSPPLHPDTYPGVLRYVRDDLLPSVGRKLKEAYGIETFDYGNLSRGAWYTYGWEPRYVTNYVGLRGRISILSEAMSYLPFRDRVVVTKRFVEAVIEKVAQDASRVIEITRNADSDIATWYVDARLCAAHVDYDTRGEEAVRIERDGARQGMKVVEVEERRLQIFDRFKASRTAKMPFAYLIHADETDTVDLLVKHGIIVEQLMDGWSGEAEEFLPTEVVQAANAFQGHRLIRLEGVFRSRHIEVAAGTFIVRLGQPLALLAFNLLEPECLDGCIAWGLLGEPTVGQAIAIRKVYAEVRAPTIRVVR